MEPHRKIRLTFCGAPLQEFIVSEYIKEKYIIPYIPWRGMDNFTGIKGKLKELIEFFCISLPALTFEYRDTKDDVDDFELVSTNLFVLKSEMREKLDEIISELRNKN